MSTAKPHMTLGSRLKTVRKKLKLSQTDMANFLGIATSTYQYYERGERDIYASILTKLTTYGVNSEWLLTGSGTPFEKDKIERGAVDKDVLTDRLPSHPAIITKFKQKDLAWEINWDLLRLERKDPGSLREIKGYLKRMLSEYIVDREGERRQKDDPEAIPGGKDRRSGKDRRETGT